MEQDNLLRRIEINLSVLVGKPAFQRLYDLIRYHCLGINKNGENMY